MTGQIQGKFTFGQFKRKVAIAKELQPPPLPLFRIKIPTLSTDFVTAHFMIINWHMMCDGVALEIYPYIDLYLRYIVCNIFVLFSTQNTVLDVQTFRW